ncbi:MATERNAL EFFECT EMBRYO ARREST 22, EMBRYO DEFECTIVE 1611 [Hibiscus trionum]|uniref:MATERNAL EFFECT EMBRYO ARREST 22, EMBRYO DEFECTIVE 1611 n=1 Tax=Hibiscus trionum TaxID=183268 RepID=A0A9W7I9N6_HIBTR|nr:MATERNAL EFFECT EMBRYO ARREST 22, EMBRYO DEFECTIVE 1611 [Hibiscus trionum]
MAADVPNTPKTSVTGAPVEDVQVSPCCQVWKNKYLKAEKGRMCLKQAVRLLEKGCDDIQTQNLKLKKAYEDEQARAKVEEEGKAKELALRVSLENELSSLKSDISNLKQKGGSDVEHKIEEIKRLGCSLSDREKEIRWLKELVEKEKKRADLEKKKAAEAAKLADTQKSKAGEEQRLADIERKKVDVYRMQLEALRKEVSEAKSKFDEATKRLQEDTRNTVEERKGADLEIAKAKEQRKIAETTKKAVEERKFADLEMAKAQEQRKIAEEMKKKAVEERNCADLEIDKAQEQRKNAEELKKKAVEERKHAALVMAKAEEQMKIAEESKKKAAEESKKAALEMAKAQEHRKIAEETKKKAVEERKHADLRMVEAEEQRQIAEETMKKVVEVRKHADFEIYKAEETKKKAVEEKLHANSITKQLEEARRRNEELEKKLHELSGPRHLGEDHFDQSDRNTGVAAVKTLSTAELRVLKVDEDKSRSVSESLQFEEVEKGKAISEREQGYSKMRKTENKRKLVEVNTKKAMEGKHCGDHISNKQLEDAGLKINELQKQIYELSPSVKMVDNLVVSSAKDLSAEVEMKLLKKQLKFQEKRVKHAKDVARLEKSRSNLLQQELGCMKLELIRFLDRLDALDKCFSTPSEGIDDMGKGGEFASMQQSKLNKKLCKTCFQTENQLLKTRCMDTPAFSPLVETVQCDTHLRRLQGRNCTESMTGINSKLESLLGGFNRKLLQSSAINSSTASFSDRQLVGSQERGAFSVTASVKLCEENLNSQPTISSMSAEVTKVRGNENFAVVAENSVRSSLPVDPPGRVNHCIRKRKMILDTVESINLLCCESKKLHLQLEDKLSVLRHMVKGQGDKPIEDAKLVRRNLQDIAYAVHDRHRKRRKTSHQETEAMEKSCEGLQMQSCPEHLCIPDTIDPKIMVGLEEVVHKNYMKLLDLDDAAEEECYRMAAERPVSPTLPDIEFPDIEASEVDRFRPIQDENCERVSVENENFASLDSFVVKTSKNVSNNLQCNRVDTSPKLLHHENECSHYSFDILRSKENGFCGTMPVERACLSNPQNSGVVMEMSVVPSPGDRVANILLENETISTVESIPKFCVVPSNIKDGSSVSRIVCATKTCMARYSLPVQTEFAVHRILQSLKVEEKLLPKEKVCVFFSLLLIDFCKATSGKCCLIRDFIPCLNLFAKHVNEAMSDAESRSVFAELCLNDLLGVIEDFLIEGRVMFCTNLSSETSMEYDSRINVLIDGLDVIFSFEAASAELLVAGSIILGSLCTAADSVSFICEAAYNIFRMHRYDTSVVLIILHVFAYVGGDKLFTLRDYSSTMTVLKSIVTFLESECVPVAVLTPSLVGDVQPQFPACVGCPFSKDALSVDIVASLLFAELQNYMQSGIMHRDLTYNSLNSSATSSEDKAKHNLTCPLDINCDAPCCIDKYSPTSKHSGSLVTGNFCDISDVLSLMELLACNMSWDWTCKIIVSQLWTILESSSVENLNVAVVILLDQLGRLGVDAVGYEDKEVENLRVKLSAFLRRETTMRAGLPIQLATVTALLGLVSLDFEQVHLENGDLAGMSGQSVAADVLRNWFLVLTEEQRAKSISFFQSVG